MNTRESSPARRRWRRRCLLALVLILVLAGYLARGLLLTSVARFLDVSEPPRQSDAVLVLGGGANDRPFVAAALVRSGLATQVLVPTVHLSSENREGLGPPEHEVICGALRARGLPPDRITLLPGECGSTLDEARSLARFLDSKPGATVTVVTHAFHTRRARRLFRRILGDRIQQVHFVAAPCDRFTAEDWWQSEDGFATYTTEYIKLLLAL